MVFGLLQTLVLWLLQLFPFGPLGPTAGKLLLTHVLLTWESTIWLTGAGDGKARLTRGGRHFTAGLSPLAHSFHSSNGWL